jgi:integrase
MASVHRKTTSKYWFARYYDTEGKQHCCSTKQTDKKKAQKVADGYEGIYRSRNTIDYVRDTFNRIAREIDPDAQVLTVKDYFKRWREGHAGELAERTLESYDKRMKDFLGFFGEVKALDAVRKSHALAFRGSIAGNASNATANHAIKIMSSVFGSAMKEGIISGNPFSDIKPLTDDSTAKETFTQEQLESLLDIADTEWTSLIMLGYYTAQRLGDLVSLTWAQVNMDKRTIYFKTEKTGRAFHREMSDTLHAFISTLQRGLPTSPLHPKVYALRERTGIGAVSKEFTRLMVLAGIAKVRPNNKKRDKEGDVSREVNPLTFHSIRHTAATDLREKAGASDSLARDIVGHDSELVDRGYVHHDPKIERATVNKLPTLKVSLGKSG